MYNKLTAKAVRADFCQNKTRKSEICSLILSIREKNTEIQFYKNKKCIAGSVIYFLKKEWKIFFVFVSNSE